MVDALGTGGTDLPHLVLPGEAISERFARRGGGGGGRRIYAVGDPAAHAARLRRDLEHAVLAGGALEAQWDAELRAQGLILAVEGWPGGFEVALESLDLRRSGIELLGVAPPRDDQSEVATVFVPDGKADRFFSTLRRYAEEQTSKGRPRHEELVANIRSVSLAAVEQLWTDAESPPATDGSIWWELWLRRTGDEIEVLEEVAARHAWRLAAQSVRFPGRTVTAVRARRSELAEALGSRLPIAELRRARLVHSPAELPPEVQREWVLDLAGRLEPAPATAPAVCLLDTGIYRHSLFGGSLEPADIHHVVGPDGVDRSGHGTGLGGLALYGDMEDALTAPGRVGLVHRLESVKLLPDPGALPNAPETYTAVTARAAAAPEAVRPRRRRVYCLAATVEDGGSDGRPTSWSATVDALAFGTDIARTGDGGLELLSDPDPSSGRLFVAAAGNIRDNYRRDYLALCDTSRVQDPAQAWNALTVGAYTTKVNGPGTEGFEGWVPLAEAGQLSPLSRTSLLFERRWPIKPDIVMEGGNLIASPAATTFDTHDAVSPTTTSWREPYGQPLTTMAGTSPASAQAARLAAIASSRYPGLWPESLRALLIHSAEWTPAMRADLDGAGTGRTQRVQLLRRFGFGTPTLERVLSSAAADVTMIRQATILPFESAGSTGRLREMHLHELPWPIEQLQDLGAAEVRLRVTLSYFVEPNPSSRGWAGRYAYPSHGLRFDIRRPLESTAAFRARLNALAEAEEGRPGVPRGQEPSWLLGPQARAVGSLHADIWTGTAADLANCGLLGVYPVGGWWKNNNRQDRMNIPVRYSLVVSLATDAEAVDLYTPIAVQIGVPVPIR